jgi:hypothetical protein
MKYWPLDVNQPTNEIKFKKKITINLFGVIYITMELDDVKHNTPKMVSNQTRPKKQGKTRIRRMIYRLYEAGRRW